MNEGSEIQKVLYKLTQNKTLPYVFLDGDYLGTDSDLFMGLESGSFFKKLDKARIEYTK